MAANDGLHPNQFHVHTVNNTPRPMSVGALAKYQRPLVKEHPHGEMNSLDARLDKHPNRA